MFVKTYLIINAISVYFVMIVGYQGAEGSYSCDAAHQYFSKQNNNDISFVNFKHFIEVFEAVEQSKIDFGVIPVENSYAGRVSEIHNILPDSNLYVVGEKILHVKHNLLGISGAQISDVRTIISHEQALMQCDKHIFDIFRTDITLQKSANTAIAAQEIFTLGDKSIACIASNIAAKKYNLSILVDNFADRPDNFTTFFIIGRDPIDIDFKSKKVITSIIFTVRNIPASIYKAIGGFATNGIDLLKLESYIPGGINSSSAQFFLSFYGHPKEKHVILAMEELGFFATKTKLLGYYECDEKRLLNS